MKTKQITMTEEQYDSICNILTRYDEEEDPKETIADMADILATIQRAYTEGEETD